MEITEEQYAKFVEYQQVAALVCMDLDVLLDLSENPAETFDFLKSHIRHFHKLKEEAINDPKARKSRYAAANLIFSAAAAGLVRDDPIGPDGKIIREDKP